MSWLLDGNVLVALAIDSHVHHATMAEALAKLHPDVVFLLPE